MRLQQSDETALISDVPPGSDHTASCNLGVIGLATMGANLARNAALRGNSVAIYNRHSKRTTTLVDRHGGEGRFTPCETLEAFVSALRRPRSIIISVAAGPPVDVIVEQLVPLLDPDDILIDAGNSLFSDTDRRVGELAAKGLRFIGMGVSGGEKGALEGPSLMLGGNRSAYEDVAPILTGMAAQVGGKPCCGYVGPGGAGHYVKMVHNGIEYADMQAIAETYDVLRNCYGLPTAAIADVFSGWREGDLASYLVDITVDVLRRRDDWTGAPLIEQVLDEAEQTGTGRWTAADALELGITATATSAAVSARSLSAQRSLRQRAAGIFPVVTQTPLGAGGTALEDVRDAMLGARIVAFSQGFEQLSAASGKRRWRLTLADIASLWRGGCIIRAALLDRIIDAYNAGDGAPLVLASWFNDTITRADPGWRRIVVMAFDAGVPVPVLSSSLAYMDGLRQSRSPANLIQGLRDEFGSHGYRRIGSDEVEHTDWGGAGKEAH